MELANIPKHIALIPDGNRRWARTHKMHLLFGYQRGVQRFIEFTRWAKDTGVNTVTVWALSTENLKNRSKTELSVLFRIYARTAMSKKLISDLKQNHARVHVIGNIADLPKSLKNAFRNLEEQTSMYNGLTINLLVNYGGKDDIVHSVQDIANDMKKKKINKIDEDTVRQHLRTSDIPDVDLVVRTSGEMRLSGLLPWQLSYSELYFAKKYWPEFSKADFQKAIQTFARRQRRFGK